MHLVLSVTRIRSTAPSRAWSIARNISLPVIDAIKINMASRPVIITSNANHGRDATITYSFTTSSGDSDMEAFELGINHQTLELERTRLSGPVFTFSLLESIGLELHQNHDGSISHDCGCQMHQAEGICKVSLLYGFYNTLTDCCD